MAWDDVLRDVDIVVNCAGSLQQGGRDDLDVVHYRAIAALASACATHGIGIVQISAVGVSRIADNGFHAYKGRRRRSRARVRMRFLDSTAGSRHRLDRIRRDRIDAHVGCLSRCSTACLRRCVDADREYRRRQPGCIDGRARRLTGWHGMRSCRKDRPHMLRDVVAAFRNWLGFQPAKFIVPVPEFLMWPLSKLADLLGLVGWRSPFRTTAVRVLKDGVTGEPEHWRALGGPKLATLTETLAQMPARTEDRRAARMSLLTPFVLAVLFIFWFASGVIGLISLDAAAGVLIDAGWPDQLSRASVVFWAAVDIAIAVALLVRRFSGAACWAMVGVSLVYLISSTIVVPQMWLDPLGPLVKVLPGIVLALVGRVMLESR